MQLSHNTIPDAMRILAQPALKLASDYGWTCERWARYADCEIAELDRLLQGYPRSFDACRRLIEATGLYLVEQVSDSNMPTPVLIGWRMPANPLEAAPVTLECHACHKSYRLSRVGGRIVCRSCAAERWIGEPYLEQLLPNVVQAFSATSPGQAG